jgi:exopolyphosphatase/guanosine-5'-triphosphate,3'-diphosphate pyrophosphatase
LKFASIDIGSNAVRLMLAQVLNTTGNYFVAKDSLIRIPIRLGEDSFTNRFISDEKKEKLIATMIGFKYLIKAYSPVDCMACATAAMREAKNSREIIKAIKEKSGIDVEIINGSKEAETICSSHIEKYLSSNSSYLYIDVGGGSTEMTLFSKGQTIISESFNIGAVRVLNGVVTCTQWDSMKIWVKENIRKHKPVEAIGSGGNINKIIKFSGKEEKAYLSYEKIEKIYDYLKSFSFDERVRILNLHMDRADVILPATNIFLKIMHWGKIKKIHIPKFGLADGLIRILYEKQNQK